MQSAQSVCELSSCIISNHHKEYNPRIKRRLPLFDLRAKDMYRNEKVFSVDDDDDNMKVL